MEEERKSTLVQVIVVRDDKENLATRNEVIANVAKASVAALDQNYGPVWEEWISGAYTKSVRRAKPKDFAKLLTLDLPHAVINDHVVAFAPMPYYELPKELARTQVSGLQTIEEDGDYYDVVSTPKHRAHPNPESAVEHDPVQATTLVINDALGMSAGKKAAQAAHGLMMSWRSMSLAYRVEFAAKGYPVHLVHVGDEQFQKAWARLTVVDNGHTEVAAKTATVKVL